MGSETEAGGPSYMVNMDGLITLLQRRTIFSVASERFGFVSARIIGKLFIYFEYKFIYLT